MYQDECIALADEINELYSDPNNKDWKPLVFQTDGTVFRQREKERERKRERERESAREREGEREREEEREDEREKKDLKTKNFAGLPRAELVAAYLAMDIGLVTPKKDGMNLVSKDKYLIMID